jgi:DNA repair protein SbcD/Mre11
MSIRILHTADLHFGKKLHGYDLEDQQRLFIHWLKETIIKEKVDWLLVAGDVFDQANPSSESTAFYYHQLLHEVLETGCRVVITAGNHDSAGLLEAPALLLNSLNVFVKGVPSQDPAECVLPVNKNGKVCCLIAMVPYLRESDIKKSIAGETYDDKLQGVRSGIKAYYDRIAEYCRINFPDIPVIATGHLFAAGSETSDSEREIQIGNLAGVDSGAFSNVFSYVALGHIHKPQEIDKQKRIFYSGSPYPLSFSERGQKKSVRIIDLDEKQLSSRVIEIPEFRELRRFTGTLADIRKALDSYSSALPLKTLAELEITEELMDSSILALKEQLIAEINERSDIQVVFSRVDFKNQPVLEIQVIEREQDLSPGKIFKDLIKEYNEDQQNELLAAFYEILEDNEGGQR